MILRGADAAASPHVGGKARALARAELAGLPVPDWFVLPSVAFDESLAASASLQSAVLEDRAALPQLVERVSLHPAIADEVTAAARDIAGTEGLVAVRSSASDEDGAEHSFAGQLESFLNVAPADVPARVRDVWHSGFTDRIVAYRRERGLRGPPQAPAVLVQRMVVPRAAGVAFSADPVSGRRGRAVVSAVPGLGSALVSGDADADTWHVDRRGVIVERRIATKRRMHVADPAAPGGVRTADVPGDQTDRPALTETEVVQIAALARSAARSFGRPQDVEWAIDDRIVLLQSRPVTSLRTRPDPDGRLVVWDNSNIVESYSGVTTPLTFSFAQEIYEYVYRQFCRMMGVPERLIEAEDETFATLLGLVRGRLYYNLLSWYRVLAMLPGYRLNRRFMEQMMGVSEPLPEPLAAAVAASVGRGRALDAFYTTRTVVRLVWNHVTLDRRVEAFSRRLEDALAPPDPPLEELRLDELVAHYRDLRGRLLLAWDAPIVNDFFAMVFYGVLRQLVMRWCGDPGGTLQNDLLGGDGGIVSAEPAVRMQRLARLAATDPSFVTVLTSGSAPAIRAALEAHPDFASEAVAYLAKFGDRTVNELKLESATLHDDPLPLYRAVGALAAQVGPADTGTGAATQSTADRLRAGSRERVREALAGRPARRAVFGWVLRHARRRVRDREKLRLDRTRLFGRVRRVFLEMGKRLQAIDVLDDPREIFFLEVDEALAFVEGRSTLTALRSLTALRATEFRGFADGPAPPARFQTTGAVYHGHDFRAAAAQEPSPGADERRGLGCSPGAVRGPVRLVRDPTSADLGHRAILVAEHTDPGWILVFPTATAILVERGSLLSHAAIVARELGIPAIVSVAGLTRWLADGDWVEMDGSTGVVRRVPTPADADA